MVQADITEAFLPTYPVGAPERNPMFFERRVYQGSSGKVYPVPFIDKISDRSRLHAFKFARMENEFVRMEFLPEIGGRIHTAQDKTKNDYDIFYRQDSIRPALVGLAGPWCSGGVEFNWPQHHRPGTFMPTDTWVEREDSGACTIWFSEHDPLNRLKGMHGVRLRPGSALIELRARVFNRTPLRQTFLWWANAAVKVHDRYQSFFPPDVRYVADHARRAISTFPLATDVYYGVDYGARPGANDLTWYRNIPVPTSYMIIGSEYDFYGGYDHDRQAGFVHVADRRIAPGKKQWTWGNHEFGRAWDRELADDAAPYIELMTGVYTDNQPDFSYLAPYETRTFSHYWWPIQDIGPVQNANERAALRMVIADDGRVELGVAAPEALDARLELRRGETLLLQRTVSVAPGRSWREQSALVHKGDPAELELRLLDAGGKPVLSYRPPAALDAEAPASAVEPPAPGAAASADELFLVGEHLEQYRHPTRNPEAYWREAIARDAFDARPHVALAQRLLARARFAEAREHAEIATRRLTQWHPNPHTGEAHYYLGISLRFLDQFEQAYDAFYRATWDYAWRAPAFYELARLDCRAGRWQVALEHLDRALATNGDNGQAVVLRAMVLRKVGRAEAARAGLQSWLERDPLDHWARFELARSTDHYEPFLELCRNDAQTILDLAFDYADAGAYEDALVLLDAHHRAPTAACATPNPLSRTAMTHFVEAWIAERANQSTRARAALAEARDAAPSYLFPSRPHEAIVLAWALEQVGSVRNAAFGLGNLLYHWERHEEAIRCWERASAADGSFATAYRNLGIAYWNTWRDGRRAREMYEKAFAADSTDARILFEWDQLRKKLNDIPEHRLEMLLSHPDLCAQRDDLNIELAALYNVTGQSAKALSLLEQRRFHPWEGGEGQVVLQYKAARLALGIGALKEGRYADASAHFEKALTPPPNLGETYHPLQSKGDIHHWLGRAHRAQGDAELARTCFERSASERGDFQQMAVTEHSELSYYRGASLLALGRTDEARAVFLELDEFARRQKTTRAQIDYFATSLPLLLVFDDDLQMRNTWEADYLSALAQLGLGNQEGGAALLENVVTAHRAHAGARQFLSGLGRVS
ncbi:DUF5107 domain-containing protein [Pendulispora rubella]|uniref:DUF5107 domain-containing protein n=1 Tax=Pendulispora rubella TaxID=2741070 RepID=A0ABZ2KSB9_9BACT